MRIERTKNASRNIVYGGFLKAYQILLPFVMRTALIYILGTQYLGLNSLFSSILQVLNLAELGVGSAMVYSMYKPIAEDDISTICALMLLYKKYYRIIGLVILVAGLILLPFLPYLVKVDTVPKDVNVFILYLLNLGTTVMTYWLFAYKNSLLSAFQRTDIQSKINLVVSTVSYALQLIVLFYLRDYYIYTCVSLVTTVCNNLVTAKIVDDRYPLLKPKGSLPRKKVQSINRRIRDLFTAKMGSVIVNSVDTIVVSAFLGLTVLAVYQNYFFVVNAIIGFISVVYSSITSGIGNSLVVETKEKNYYDLVKLSFIICWISCVCSACYLSLIQPFMKLWVGEKLMLEYSVVICFTVYFYTREVNQLLNTYKDAGGIWHKDRFRPLVTGIANLGMNLLTVRFLGIYGIILSTVLSMLFVGMPWLVQNLFSTLFERNSMIPYLKKLFTYIGVSAAVCLICCVLCNRISFESLWKTILIRSVVCAIVSNLMLLICFKKSKEFKEAIGLLDRVTHGKYNSILKTVK